MQHTFIADRYTLHELLGIGSTAKVYRAYDRKLGREVALKILTDPHATDPDSLECFYKEVRSTASLSHPQVVAVYDLGRTSEGYPYMAMEYVGGGTLKQRLLREGALPPVVAVGIAHQICEALAAAHAQGMVHRDIKPQNVLLTATDEVKVADFGISGPIGEVSALGTINYASPEQRLGRALGPLSDLYSLGVILYEMLTGGKPFSSGTPQAVAARHVIEIPPRLAEMYPGLPEGLDALVMGLLAKDPDHRCGSIREGSQVAGSAAEELAADLKRLREDLQHGSIPSYTTGEREDPWEEQTGAFRSGASERPVVPARTQARVRRRKLLRPLGASAAALAIAVTLFAAGENAVSWPGPWPANVFEASADSGGGSADGAPAVSGIGAEKSFVHRATPENIFANSTYLDHPTANGNAGAIISVTQNWNPGGSGEVYSDHHIGVWYDTDAGRWAIFNQDREPVTEGAAFNVLVLEGPANR